VPWVAVHDHARGSGFDPVQHVVELFGQVVDVVPVKGRDERPVEAVDDVVGDLVAPLLDRLDRLGPPVRVAIVIEEVLEHLAALEDVFGGPVEQDEEGLFPRKQTQHHGGFFYRRVLSCRTAAAGGPPGAHHRPRPTAVAARISAQPNAKETGSVNTHARTMFHATPQRTQRTPLLAPIPRIAPLMAWVVLIGTPNRVAISIVVAAAVSAAKPSTGCSFVRRNPMVRTIRHPPAAVPSPIASAAASITHSGT